MKATLMRLSEMGYIPDIIVRLGIRNLLHRRLAGEYANYQKDPEEKLSSIIKEMSKSPIAPIPDKANEQHYEVPNHFFTLVLGKYLKYSSGYWRDENTTLEESETDMLNLTCQRARLTNGIKILELGCGWGSLTLWMAKQYPDSKIVAVSNSHTQRKFIEDKLISHGLANVEVITCDMNDFQTSQKFDRIVSIEMFEHMRNYELLLNRISSWLSDEGKLFIHIFCHKKYTYKFLDRGKGDWMARHFFSGGIMPSANLLYRFQKDVELQDHWQVSGKHYKRTSLAWLHNIDRNRNEILELFRKVYGQRDARMWFGRWRIFFMACEELFGFRDGNEWFVSHYLFTKYKM